MEEKSSYAVKLSPEVKKRLKEFCREHGLKQGYFVEKAIKECHQSHRGTSITRGSLKNWRK